LLVFDATPSDAGNYTIVVSNRYGSAESDAATLNVNRSPQIAMKEPVCKEILAGKSVVLGVRAKDTMPLVYQWTKDGLNISGATSSTYTVTNATENDTGSYGVLVSNGHCQVETNIGNLKVVRPICKLQCHN
jgi:Immunoglobulin domain